MLSCKAADAALTDQHGLPSRLGTSSSPACQPHPQQLWQVCPPAAVLQAFRDNCDPLRERYSRQIIYKTAQEREQQVRQGCDVNSGRYTARCLCTACQCQPATASWLGGSWQHSTNCPHIKHAGVSACRFKRRWRCASLRKRRTACTMPCTRLSGSRRSRGERRQAASKRAGSHTAGQQPDSCPACAGAICQAPACSTQVMHATCLQCTSQLWASKLEQHDANGALPQTCYLAQQQQLHRTVGYMPCCIYALLLRQPAAAGTWMMYAGSRRVLVRSSARWMHRWRQYETGRQQRRIWRRRKCSACSSTGHSCR